MRRIVYAYLNLGLILMSSTLSFALSIYSFIYFIDNIILYDMSKHDELFLFLHVLCPICAAVFFLYFAYTMLRFFVRRITYQADVAVSEEQSYKVDERALQIDRLIKYNQQRKEIEEEIRYLTRQLSDSDLAQYMDINRLAFSGQNNSSITNSISYDAFISRFGLDKRDIAVKKGTAAFLTPFTREGDELFYNCQKILGRIDLFVRRTDNFVKKDDILMNIVSLIVQSEFILVNIDDRNPNVFYELGIAHAIGKPTILLSKSKHDFEKFEFDVQGKSIIIYDDPGTLETQLLRQISMLKDKMAAEKENGLD